MKIGSIDIKKAYYGALELTNSNAFVGTVPVIDGSVPSSGKYKKITNTSELSSGTKFVYVNTSTGQVITTDYNLSSSNKGFILSNESVTITNNEFSANDLNNIKTITVWSSSTSSTTRNASPLILTKTGSGSSYVNLFSQYHYDIDGKGYLWVTSSSNAYSLGFRSSTVSWGEYLKSFEYRGSVSSKFLMPGKDNYGTFWLTNWPSYSSTTAWPIAIFKFVDE